MMQDPKHVQLILFEANREAQQYNEYAMMDMANRISHILSRRKLPLFYFSEAAATIGVTHKTCRAWNINQMNGANRMGDGNLTQKVAIYMAVFARLREYPEDETYADATRRLQARITELEASGFTRNQISQQMGMSYRTLKEIMERDPEKPRRHNHCPWNLLATLGGAEQNIRREKERQAEKKHTRIIHDDISQGRPEIGEEPPYNPNWIIEGGDCAKCFTPWYRLKPDGVDAWKRRIMVCGMCGTDNVIVDSATSAEDPDTGPPPLEEFIKPYQPCWNCAAPAHNLKRERVDRWGNTVYLCELCANINRIRPRRRNPVRTA